MLPRRRGFSARSRTLSRDDDDDRRVWNLRGQGTLRSLQYRTGYVIGTRHLFTVTRSPLPMGAETFPIDFLEGIDRGAGLAPTSLYEDQLARRLEK